MQKQMRTGVEFDQLRRGEKPDKVHVPRNTEPGGEHFQFRLEWSFAGDEKFRMWMVLLKDGEGTQTGGHAFLWNQTAGLHHVPVTIARRLSIYHRKFIQGNTGAIDSQLFGRATELD